MIHSNSNFDNINFNGGNLSSDGGHILISQFLKQMGLKSLLKSIPFCDSRRFPVYSNVSILIQLIIRCILGYNSQSDQKILENDPLLSHQSSICSQSTVSRFFDRVSNITNNVFHQIIMKLAAQFIDSNVENPILDADSTLITTNGKQQASAYIHHYQDIGYHPLVINEYHSKLLLFSSLRTGSAYSSNGIVEALKQILSLLKNNKKIRFRGDSAFYRKDLFEFLEKNKIKYYIRIKGFKKYTRESLEDMVMKDIDWNQFNHSNPYYGELKQNDGRRIIYKTFYTVENGMKSLIPVVYCIITNDYEISPKEAMDFYEARGNSENFTKELKDDFDAGTLSHKEFEKNEMEFLISSLSYNLYHIYQNQILEKDDKKIRMNTYRIRYQKIAVKVVQHARQITLSYSSVYKYQKQFLHYWNKILLT